jgi:hypothetical protein
LFDNTIEHGINVAERSIDDVGNRIGGARRKQSKRNKASCNRDFSHKNLALFVDKIWKNEADVNTAKNKNQLIFCVLA